MIPQIVLTALADISKSLEGEFSVSQLKTNIDLIREILAVTARRELLGVQQESIGGGLRITSKGQTKKPTADIPAQWNAYNQGASNIAAKDFEA